jgi:tRNA-splicing ligase RtcB
MFVIASERLPIKAWLDDQSALEPGTLQQARNVANLPFAYKHIALMPDCHQGYGVPIGCVFAAKDVIVPNAVGSDIGCGMCFVQSNLPAAEVSTSVLQDIVGSVMRRIPTGFNHHKKPQECTVLSSIKYRWSNSKLNQQLEKEIEAGRYQIGTLGGGNHFIEIQRDEEGMVCIMVHSGSRNFGYKIANAYNRLAKQLNARWGVQVPPEWGLAFLPVDTTEGQDYISWMNLALDFAQENRAQMMTVLKDVISQVFPDIQFEEEINAHHNYAALEHHFGQNVWVHRKGAIMARRGALGIIPGSMGTPSFIVEGLGNPDSFCSSSHGAGRRLGRKEALRQIPAQQTIEDLKSQGILLGKRVHKEIGDGEPLWPYSKLSLMRIGHWF